jgi:hypothetical protein
MKFTLQLSRRLCVSCLLLTILQCGVQASTGESSSPQGDGEEVTGKSSSAITAFDRFRRTCSATVDEFIELLDHTSLEAVYTNGGFKSHLTGHQRSYFFHAKIAPSKLSTVGRTAYPCMHA